LTFRRNKLRASDDPDRIFHAVRAVIADTGVVAGKHRRVLTRRCWMTRWPVRTRS
jgi:hypothetical protein